MSIVIDSICPVFIIYLFNLHPMVASSPTSPHITYPNLLSAPFPQSPFPCSGLEMDRSPMNTNKTWHLKLQYDQACLPYTKARQRSSVWQIGSQESVKA